MARGNMHRELLINERVASSVSKAGIFLKKKKKIVYCKGIFSLLIPFIILTDDLFKTDLLT